MSISSNNHSGAITNGAALNGHYGHPNVSAGERIAAGVAGAALAAVALSRTKDNGVAKALPLGLVSGFLLYRSATGYCPAYSALRTGTSGDTESPSAVIPHGQGIKVVKAMTIQKPASELYAFWRNFENLPHFMKHLEKVEIIDDTHSVWTAKAPLGQTVTWNAEVIVDEPDYRIAWRSVEPADIANAGSVIFKTLPQGRGTAVTVTLEYNPPAGKIGAAIAKLLGEEPSTQINDDLRHFKQLMEAGEIPTIGGQPHGITGHSAPEN